MNFEGLDLVGIVSLKVIAFLKLQGVTLDDKKIGQLGAFVLSEHQKSGLQLHGAKEIDECYCETSILELVHDFLPIAIIP